MNRLEIKQAIALIEVKIEQAKHWLIKNDGNTYATKVRGDLRDMENELTALKQSLWNTFPTMDEAKLANEVEAYQLIRDHHRAITDEEKAIEVVIWSKIKTLEVGDVKP